MGGGVTLEQARKEVQLRSGLITTDGAILNSVIYAALRVWLLIIFRAREDESLGANRPSMEWPENASLKDTLDQVVAISTTELTLNQRRFSPHFTVANMVSICGLRIEWASTLDDHLYLDRQHKVLRVFPYRDWLLIKVEAASRSKYKSPVFAEAIQAHGNPSQPANSNHRICSAPLPAEVYEETSRTLDLLFPSWDKRTQKFLKRKGKQFHSSHSQNRLLDLKHYPYWKDRILELNEDIFLGPVEGWAQLWNDRRDPQKFWKFWIALAVFTLTTASTVASILQTWAASRTSA
ncbi:hypothetical protein LTR70_007108 [Exophiala xenobiotica]|uniref:Uncharacterized protein n=1 Tax=Lithohypha guttulata TaxID=1690604 RepID=A0ABR0K6M5_9EURO|nr:hypothetical protein LTR24_006305 [Lithohypha guttulata]KAK5314479.1 hypothetical protein LTR70_007108 [Exophiala xenobiotica]